MRECYTSERTRIDAELDSLARDIAAEFRKVAQDPGLGPVVGGLMRKTATEIDKSQKSWMVYRYQHCKALAYSWTTGSGAGTAEQACLFNLGKLRLQQLKSDFNGKR